MLVVFKEPGKKPEEREISGDLSGMQEAVGGYIETFMLPGGIVLVFDEEGRLSGKARNIVIPRVMLGSIMPVSIAGSLFACAAEGEELRGLDEAEAHYAKQILEVCNV